MQLNNVPNWDTFCSRDGKCHNIVLSVSLDSSAAAVPDTKSKFEIQKKICQKI